MKTLIIHCDHCGIKVPEKEAHTGYADDDKDYCQACYEEQQGVWNAGNHLNEYLQKRWHAGGLELTGEGVVNIEHIALPTETSTPWFAAAVLTVKPLDVLAGDMQIGPYHLQDCRGERDEYGKDGFDIFRDGKRVGIIRWRKGPKGKERWEHASCWDQDKPGELLWNMADADEAQNLGEAVQMAIYDLETGYNTWINNLLAKIGSPA